MASSARIDELRKKFDENPRRYFAPLANEYRKAGDLEQAVFICQEYLPQQPGHMSGYIVYGQALFELSRLDESKAVFETALSLDPENLIALRHLGDIARQSGDASSARTWYQRVLEADPRNEEIGQLMLTLLADAPPSSAPAAEPLSADAASGAPAPAVDVQVAAPTGAPASAGDSSPFVVEKSHDDALGDAATAAAARQATPVMVEPAESRVTPFVPPAQPSAPSAPRRGAHLPPEELLDLNEFTIGGVPIMDVGDGAPTAAAGESGARVESSSAIDSSEPAFASVESSAESADEEGFTLGHEDGPFEEDPFAIAAVPHGTTSVPADPAAEPIIESATDIELGIEGIPTADDAARAAAADDAPSVSGLEVFDAGAPLGVAEPAATIEVESFLDTTRAPQTPADSPVVETQAYGGSTAMPTREASEAHEPSGPAEAFVTETMADLYLRQGHLESALGIYERLAEQRPDDGGFRERVNALRERLYGEPAPVRVERDTPGAGSVDQTVPAASTSAGPTIREFLFSLVVRGTPASIAAQEPASVDEWSAVGNERDVGATDRGDVAGVTSVGQTDDASEASLESVEAFDPIAANEAPRATPLSSDTVSGSIGALFSGVGTGAPPAPSDVAAASALSEAFASDGPETAPLRGVPAHRAANELSLDHVFKSNTPPRSGEEVDGFSFDQFFAEGAADSAAAAGAGAAGGASAERDVTPSAAPDDVAQFNAWLNGLKKT